MNPNTFPSEHFFDLVVIGSGPAALSVVTRILESRPAALYTEEEHIHLHWLRKNGKGNNQSRISKTKSSTKDNKRPFLKTKSVGRGNERVIVPQSNTDQHCQCDGSIKILIIDRLGEWMANWDRLFGIYQIPHLRSPLFFHPAPADLDALVAFAERKGRMKIQTPDEHLGKVCPTSHKESPDLIEVPGCVGKEISKHKRKKRAQQPSKRMGDIVNERERRDYFTPSTKLFHDFIREDCIKRYGLDNEGKPWPNAKEAFQNNSESDKRIQFVRGEVCNLDWTTLHISGWEKLQGFSVELKDGVRIASKAVVCAGGPGATPGVPDYLAKTNDESQTVTSGPGWCHSTQLGMQGRTLPPLTLQRRIKDKQPSSLVVIGGGLTSAQICDVAIRSGVEDVTLLMRGYFKIKPFDMDLEWVARYANLEKMRFWQEDDPQKRLERMYAARNGGSINPRYAKLIKKYQQEGKLKIMTCTKVDKAEWTPANEHDQNDDGEWSLDITTKEKVKKPCKSNASTKSSKGEESEDESIADDEVEFKEIKQTLRPHYIISATGAAPKFSKVPFLKNIAEQHPVPEYGGLPWLTESLQYGKLPLFCTGAFSALQVSTMINCDDEKKIYANENLNLFILQIGPGAFNLEGMRAAADRIAVRLQELAIGQDDEGIESTPQKKTNDSQFISQFTHFAYQHLPQEVEA